MRALQTDLRAIHFLQFAVLARRAELVHGVSRRTGGASEGHLASLNLSYAVGDEPGRVAANRDAFCAALGVDPAGVVCAQQVHGVEVARVGRAEGGRGYADRATAVVGADALIADEPGVYLWLTFADCVPVLLYDPVRRAVGLAHAGWRGTVGHIAARTAEAMAREFGTRPADLIAGVGPAIGPCCYQVGPEVAEAVRAAFPDAPDLLRPDDAGRERLDLPLANARLLARAGVPPERIELAGYCTACRTDLFYSHRAEQGRTGRMAAVIGLRPGTSARSVA